jgi:hypothetical protein
MSEQDNKKIILCIKKIKKIFMHKIDIVKMINLKTNPSPAL